MNVKIFLCALLLLGSGLMCTYSLFGANRSAKKVTTNVRSPAKAAPLPLNEQLYNAASSGNLSEVQSLLAQKTDPNSITQGQTPLMAAIHANSAEVISELLAHDADPTMSNSLGETPLFIAAGSLAGKVEMVQILLDAKTSKKININAQTKAGETPLLTSATQIQPAITQALLNAGADPFICNHEGHAPLYFAAWLGHLDTVKLILNAQDSIIQKAREENPTRAKQLSEKATKFVSDALNVAQTWSDSKNLEYLKTPCNKPAYDAALRRIADVQAVFAFLQHYMDQ